VLLNAVPVRMCVEGTDLKLSDEKKRNDIAQGGLSTRILPSMDTCMEIAGGCPMFQRLAHAIQRTPNENCDFCDCIIATTNPFKLKNRTYSLKR
jgi:hypothetical protein